MIFEPAILRPLHSAWSGATAMVRAVSDDTVGATALARLRAQAARPEARWLPAMVNGALPPGVHDVSIGAFFVQLGGTPRRDELLRPFAARVEALREQGVMEIFVGGSIATDSAIPHDLDALVRAKDAHALGMGGRLRDMSHGVNWHIAEQSHTSPNPGWAPHRPTWMTYFQFDRQLQPRGIARILLD